MMYFCITYYVHYTYWSHGSSVFTFTQIFVLKCFTLFVKSVSSNAVNYHRLSFKCGLNPLSPNRVICNTSILIDHILANIYNISSNISQLL